MSGNPLDLLQKHMARRGLDVDAILERATVLTEERLHQADQTIQESRQRCEKERLPDRHLNLDFFVCDLVDYALKDDQATMEAPIFALATKSELRLWRWVSADGRKSVEVAPSVYGRATMHDKDVLIYLTSQLVAAINQGRTPSRTVRFTVYDFLVATNRLTGGECYDRLEEALQRLRGTTITTNIKTGRTRITESFGIIDRWCVVEKSPTDSRMVAVEVTVSEWLYHAIQAQEVLTINRGYFRLRRPLERRLYEIARKHCGKQGAWEISLERLREKCGSTASPKEFKRMLREIVTVNVLPDYVLVWSGDGLVQFYDRDARRVVGQRVDRSR